MLARARQFLRLRPGHGLLIVFGLTILLPGMLLAFFGLRALRQERRLADQQIRERLDRAAELAVRDLEQELGRWQQAVEQLSAASLPEPVRRALVVPGSAVVVFQDGRSPRVLPAGEVLYEVGPVESPAPERPLPAALIAAETQELRQRDYAQAIALYQQALATLEPAWRPMALQRLARTYHKQGRLEEAQRAYRELAALPQARIGALPADLVARHELCSLSAGAGALEFYRDLISARWQLEKSRYLFYSESVRRWLASSEEAARLRAIEQRKLSFSGAVEELLAAPRRVLGAHLAFWRSEPFAAVVLAESYLRAQVWPQAFTSVGADLEVSLLGPGGEMWFGRGPIGRPELGGVRALGDWRVQIWPGNPAALYADLARRQNLYLAMLLLVVALLVFGSYLTARTLKRELEIARLKSGFVSAVSHEFRSPLTGIRQLGELLMRGRVPSEERRQEYYRLITRESDRLARLVENVLDFSRMEEGRKEYRFEPLDAGIWLRDLAASFQSEVAERGYQIQASVPPQLPPLVADREALSLAVRNLLDNAVKYSPDSKTVWLEAEASDARLSIRVRDRGLGIAAQDQKHIFEKFYRGGGEIARQVKGVGLGLSLVKHIVEAHGGAVEFESRAGEGSTFSIHLKV